MATNPSSTDPSFCQPRAICRACSAAMSAIPWHHFLDSWRLYPSTDLPIYPTCHWRIWKTWEEIPKQKKKTHLKYLTFKLFPALFKHYLPWIFFDDFWWFRHPKFLLMFIYIGLLFFGQKNQPKKATKCQRRNFLWASENVGLIQSPSCQVIGIITPGNQLSLGSVGLKSWNWWSSGLKMKLKTGIQSWSLIWDKIGLKGI